MRVGHLQKINVPANYIYGIKRLSCSESTVARASEACVTSTCPNRTRDLHQK